MSECTGLGRAGPGCADAREAGSKIHRRSRMIERWYINYYNNKLGHDSRSRCVLACQGGERLDQPRWGWAGRWSELVAAAPADIAGSLLSHHRQRFADLALGPEQVMAWEELIHVCQATLAVAVEQHPELAQALIAFEYELWGEAGRRCDVVLVLPTGHVLVIEFKVADDLRLADLDQVVGYARDLKGYQSNSHHLAVDAMLVLTKAPAALVPPPTHAAVLIDRPADRRLAKVIRWAQRCLAQPVQAIDPLQWLDGDYEPLPVLIKAAADIFARNPLPQIRTIKESHIPELLTWLDSLIERAAAQQEHYLVLITGRPGAGKTLVGLECVARQNGRNYPANYISGNGPLVAVLQDCLERLGADAKAMIRGMYEFKRDTVGRKRWPYYPRVFVFDEGQRAWVEVNDFHGTEIQLLIEVASRAPWGVVIGLLGEGQEIWKKEDGSIQKWLQDFEQSDRRDARWQVFAPEGKVVATETVHTKPFLHLHTTVRAKQTLHLHRWVNALLEDVPPADVSAHAERLHTQGFPVYVTDNRQAAEAYVRYRYQASGKLFGWVASSQSKDSDRNPHGLPQIERPRTFLAKRVYGRWYNDGECRLLKQACSEFGCQGLELDFALVYWGRDLQWTGSGWHVPPGTRSKTGKPVEHTLNVYRVLLTRAREGMVIYCPNAATAARLRACGVADLVEAQELTRAMAEAAAARLES